MSGECLLLFRTQLKWQLDGESGPFAEDAFDPDTAVMLLDHLPANAEPQAAAAMSVLVRFLGGIEGLKDEAELIGGNADAGIGNQNLHHLRLLIFADFNSQSSAPRHGLASIDKQVQENLLDLAGNYGSMGSIVEFRLHMNVVLAQVFVGQNKD